MTRERIADTYRTLAPFVRRTPVIETKAADFGLQGANLALKLECLQYSGSFKARGAFANLRLRHIPPAGVVAASGGNHGAAVAFAAMTLGVPATIFVPSIASPSKIQRIRSYGANLIVQGERYADALEASRRWQAQSGAMDVHAFDAVETMLGTATIGLELAEQLPALDTLIVPVGGGGLIAGIASWFGDSVNIVGVEPELAPKLTRALAAGTPVDTEVGGIAADSLGPRRIGERTFPIIARLVSSVLVVSDDDMRAAQALLWERLSIIAEPAGAAASAALLCGHYRPATGERVCVIVSGANTTAVDFSRVERQDEQ